MLLYCFFIFNLLSIQVLYVFIDGLVLAQLLTGLKCFPLFHLPLYWWWQVGQRQMRSDVGGESSRRILQFRWILSSHCPVCVWSKLRCFSQLHISDSSDMQEVRPPSRAGLQGREQTGAEACGPVGAQNDRCCPGIALATATAAWHPFIEVILSSSHSALLTFQLSWGQEPNSEWWWWSGFL